MYKSRSMSWHCGDCLANWGILDAVNRPSAKNFVPAVLGVDAASHVAEVAPALVAAVRR